MHLETPIKELRGVGQALEKRLRHLGIAAARDLLFYFPFRYEDYRHTVPIAELRAGEQVTVRGTVEMIANKRSPRKRTVITEAILFDATGRLRAVWFGQPFIAKSLRSGDSIFLSGKVSEDMFGRTMVGAMYEKDTSETTVHTGRIVPLYSLTAGITQKQMRFLVSQVLPLAGEIDDWLDDDIRKSADVAALQRALQSIHFPEDDGDRQAAERRLKFDELFLLQLHAEMSRQTRVKSRAPALAFHEKETREFVSRLPYKLTPDQKKAAWEILQDMEKTEPMNRLLEGDVGSGKTVVAAVAGLNAVLSGWQVAFMAPTEILAEQHYDSFRALFARDEVKVGLMTANTKMISDKVMNDKELSPITYHLSQIIIGTHALLTERVKFEKLGLVIVDEQHRFGVEQRKAMKEKTGQRRLVPHFLSMTATPIPRSFALTMYGDLDLSVLMHKPAGRKPILTRLVEPHNREKAYDFIRGQVKQGRQVFVVCPMIEHENIQTSKHLNTKTNNGTMVQWNNPVSDKKSVLSEHEKLSKKIFPDLRVGYVHGKLKSKEKDAAMKNFANGGTDILVSTSVVEVGVNIPNASVMMIEGAERFGLAQLHQFRGRVGRAEHHSYCFVFTDSDSAGVKERLGYFEKNNDGFALAEYDLQTRGPGEVYGTAQSGMMSFRLATMRDAELISLSRQLARGIDFKNYPRLEEKVKEWEEETHFE